MRHDIVRTRPLGSGDDAALGRFYHGLSPLTVHARFFVDSLRDIDALARAVDVDQRRHLAVVAEQISAAGAEIIGVARAVVGDGDPGCAEFAIVVADAWQGRGIGRALVRRLAIDSRRRGVLRWRVVRLTGNHRVDRLVQDVAVRESTVEAGGVVEATYRLPPASVRVG